MIRRCQCTPEEIRAGHRGDCIYNPDNKPTPLPPPRKPFEEMTRDEMIVAHTYLRASCAEYIADMHAVCRAGIGLIDAIKELAPLSEKMQQARDALARMLGMPEPPTEA